jgi:3-hydroxyisobutyrate dehydrogenase-like beta-hydroxyacid dehydrogenase
MGSALARTLSAAGLNVTVWNRNPEKANRLEPGTVRIATTVEEAVSAGSVVVVCVRDYEVTNQLLRGSAVERALSGRVILQLSTGTPAQAREAASWASGVGASYLDGAIIAFPDAIGNEDCAILYAGRADVFASCQRVVRALGGISPLVGDDPGSAAALDSGLLSIYFSFVFGVAHGAAICDAANVPLPLFEEMATSMLPIMGDVLSRSVAMITADDFESQHSTLETSVGAMAQVASVAQESGLDTRFIELMRAYARQALEAGHGSVGNAVLFKLFRRAQ